MPWQGLRYFIMHNYRFILRIPCHVAFLIYFLLMVVLFREIGTYSLC